MFDILCRILYFTLRLLLVLLFYTIPNDMVFRHDFHIFVNISVYFLVINTENPKQTYLYISMHKIASNILQTYSNEEKAICCGLSWNGAFLFTLNVKMSKIYRIIYDLNQFRLSKNNYSVNPPIPKNTTQKKKLFEEINCSANIPGNSIPIGIYWKKMNPTKCINTLFSCDFLFVWLIAWIFHHFVVSRYINHLYTLNT